MNPDALQAFLQEFASMVAAELPTGPSDDLTLLDINQLSAETGLGPDYLKRQCRMWEAGNPEGLRCIRKDPGKRNSPILVGRDWFLEWRDNAAERNRQLQNPELARAVARMRSKRRVSKGQ